MQDFARPKLAPLSAGLAIGAAPAWVPYKPEREIPRAPSPPTRSHSRRLSRRFGNGLELRGEDMALRGTVREPPKSARIRWGLRCRGRAGRPARHSAAVGRNEPATRSIPPRGPSTG